MGEASSSPKIESARAHPHHSNLHLSSHMHSSKIFDGEKMKLATNIVRNHDFKQGLDFWNPIEGHAYVAESASAGYAVITNRTMWWSQLRQDVTSSVTPGLPFTVSAIVAVSGSFTGTSEIHATLHLRHNDSTSSYLKIARIHVVKDEWALLQGSFVLESSPKRVAFYLEGPDPGLDLLVRSVIICPTVSGNEIQHHENLILNHQFDDGLNEWSGLGCNITLLDSLPEIQLVSDQLFAATKNRTEKWNGIEQDITERVHRKVVYEATAVVRIYGNDVSSADVTAKLRMKAPNTRTQYVFIASVQASDSEWIQLQGKFLINGSPSKVVIYIEGPPPGTDILVKSLVVKLAEPTPVLPPLSIEKSVYAVNIIENSELGKGTHGWIPHGGCSLNVGNGGSPSMTPPLAKQSLGYHKPLSGRYILVTDRLLSSSGPAQIITDKLKLFVTYQVSAWVKIGSGPCVSCGPETVIFGLCMDSHWVNLGEVDATIDRWHEVRGCFRIEGQPSEVMFNVYGPSSDVDLMVAGLQIFAVDREKRFEQLKMEADKIRKRDVVLRFTDDKLLGSFVKVKQATNSFPVGSCIDRKSIENEDFVEFFVKNFNWATFKELKSSCEIDEMIKLCQENKIQLRGHCNFWEELGEKSWADILSNNELISAFEARLELLLTRFKGKFKNFDMKNNIMYWLEDEPSIAKVFKTAQNQDPNTVLFVNDHDTIGRITAEKYIEQICTLQEKGAPVGGIGVSGDMGSMVGAILGSTFDKLGVLGLPIWITGLTVSSANEHVRADDLEVVLREAFAHPSVEGVMLSGFWENKLMGKQNSHLVNEEGSVNEAGKRLIKIKEEWMTDMCGHVDEQGEFRFRGFHGSYEVEVVNKDRRRASKKFVVEKDYDSTLVLNIDI